MQNNLKLNLTSDYSEFVADSLLSIIQKDPRRISFLLQKLTGKQLTNNLRQFIWSDILLRHERKKLNSLIQVDLKINFFLNKFKLNIKFQIKDRH